MAQFHFTPDRYLELIRAEVPQFDRLEDEVAAASAGLHVERILELGTGSGETSRRVLELYPLAHLVGIDVSDEMLAEARKVLPPERIEALVISGIQDPLPEGPFDLVVSALAIHHVDGPAKAELFERVARALRPGGRFVMGDVVIPEDPADEVTPLTSGYDMPSRPAELLDWLDAAGFRAEITWSFKDVLVARADAAPPG